MPRFRAGIIGADIQSRTNETITDKYAVECTARMTGESHLPTISRYHLHGRILQNVLSVAIASGLTVRRTRTLPKIPACGQYSLSTNANLLGRGGDVDPHILVKWIKEDVPEGSDPIASMIIFEWKDYDLIGVEVHTPSRRPKCCTNANLPYRTNIFVIRILYKLASVMSTKRENLSWHQTRLKSLRMSSSLRQFI